MTIDTPRSLSNLLTNLAQTLNQEVLTIGDILKGFHERGFGMALFFFALPAALPLPGLGINLIIAAPLLFLTVQQMLGRSEIWFPARIRAKTMSRERFESMIEKVLPWVRRLEYILRPRLAFVTQGVFSNIIGLTGVIMALSICVPLPLTNTVPAFGIALMAAGTLMCDGLAVLCGMVIGLAWVALLVGTFIFLGAEALDLIKDMIKSIV